MRGRELMIDKYSELWELCTPYYALHALTVLLYFPSKTFLVRMGNTFFAEAGQMTDDWLTREQVGRVGE